MANETLTTLRYDASDYEFLRESIGFTDSNRDGILTSREIKSKANDAFRDFYATNLDAEEKSILASFAGDRILSAELFAYEPELDDIALKALRAREYREIVTAKGLPEKIDTAKLDFDLSRGAGHLFDAVTVDLDEIRGNLETVYWNALMKDDPSCFKTNTVRVLRQLIRRHAGESKFTITYAEWEKAYGAIVGCLVNGNVDSAESTWNEILIMWQKSDADWHVVADVADWVHSVVDGGMARIGTPDLELGSAGIRRYVQFPREYVFPVKPPPAANSPSPLRRATVRTASSWPSAASVTLASGAGIAVNLDVDAGATITAYQEVSGGELPFFAGKPLLRLDGFHVNVDARSGFMRKASTLAGQFLSLFGTTFDVETLTGVAVTVFHNRLCLVVQGECGSTDLVSPVGCDYLFFDIGFFVRDQLNAFDPSGIAAKELFNTAGDVYESVPLSDLQAAIVAALKKGTASSTSGGLSKALPFKNWRHELRAEGIEANFSDQIRTLQKNFADDNEGLKPSAAVTHLGIENGEIFGVGTLPTAFSAQGRFDLTLGFETGDARIGDANGVMRFPVEFHLDTAKKAGYARVKLPSTAVKGLGNAWDGEYAGEVLVGISLTGEDVTENGEPSLEKLLALVNARVFVDLHGSHGDFLAAAIEVSRVETEPGTLTLRKLVAEYDLAVAGKGRRLHGVIHDGRVTLVKRHDDNRYLTHQIGVGADAAVFGGLINVFGKNAVVSIEQDETGVYFLKPAFKGAKLSGGSSVSAANLGGEIRVTPPLGAGTYKVEFADLSVDIADAEILLNGAIARGRTHAVVNGTWSVPAKDLVSLLSFDGEWVGSGTLRLNISGSNLKVVSNGIEADATVPELSATVAIESMRFAPFSARGRASTKVSDANFSLSTPLVDISTDVSGRVSAKGSVPLVTFTAKGSTHSAEAMLPALPDPALGPNVIRQSFDESGYLSDVLQPLIDQMRGAPASQTGAEFFISRDFPYEEAAASLGDVGFEMGKLPLAFGAEYTALRGREVTTYPLFPGFLSFLNPRIEAGSFLTTAAPQTLADDGKLGEFKISLNNPIRFLGFRITGIGVEKAKCAFQRRERNHVYIYTERGRIDLMTLLRLRFPCKMARLYRNLRERGVKLSPNEIPSELTDAASYFEEVLKVFDIDTKLREEADHQARPILASEFSDISRKQALSLWEALKSLNLPRPMPRTSTKSSLLAYVNEVAKDPGLSDHLRPQLDKFAPADQGWAEDYLDEIDLIGFEAEGAAMSDEDQATVLADNYRLMHLFVSPYLPHVEYLDFNHSEDLLLTAPDVQLKRADYGIIQIREDAEAPLNVAISYNPTDSAERVAHPGFYADLAMKDGDAIENAAFNYKTPTLWFKAEFARIDGLQYYLGRYTPEHSADFGVVLYGYDARNVEATYMPPTPFNRPSFSIFSPQSAGIPVGNEFVGARFQVGQFNDDLAIDIGIEKGSADNTFVYFYLGDGGKERDILIDASEAAVSGIDAHVVNAYDPESGEYTTSFNKVTGNVAIDTLPEGKPRALMYLGTTPEGARRYLILNNLESKGRFDIENDALALRAHVGFLATLPDSIYDSPTAEALKAKGVEFKIEAIRLDGTMDFAFDETSASLKSSPESRRDLVATGGFADTEPADHDHADDITLTLYGSFRFNFNGSWVTFTDITIPLDALMFKLVAEKGLNEVVASRVALESIVIPARRELSAGIDMNVEVPASSLTGDVRLRDGTVTLSSASPFTFRMEDDTAGFSTDGLNLKISDSQNRLDLSSGQITYHAGDGTVKTWKLEGRVKDQIYELIVDVALKGKLLDFHAK